MHWLTLFSNAWNSRGHENIESLPLNLGIVIKNDPINHQLNWSLYIPKGGGG